MKIINIFSGDVVFEEERPLPNEEDLIKYITELLSRLEAGEKTIEEVEVLKGCRDHWQTSYNDVRKKYYLDSKRLIVQEEMYENLKCCGNCSHTNDVLKCDYELPMTESGNCCPKWQTDLLTKSQREIK